MADEPGVRHEHKCLASSQHPGLDHTCECGFTWAGLSPRSWLIWLPNQELWRTPTHWSWRGECEANKARSHFCAGGHVDGDNCRCACGETIRALDGGE